MSHSHLIIAELQSLAIVLAAFSCSRFDSRVKAMELDERPTEQYSDIGGLDKQIEEVCTNSPNLRQVDILCEDDSLCFLLV